MCKSILFVILAIFIGTGCAQKTTIKAIKASKISDKAVKNIGVIPFTNDKISQSSQIDSVISNTKINDKSYFNLVDRNNLVKVLGEKRLNDSGLVNLIKKSKNNGLSQIETILTGKVNVSDMATSEFLEARTDYNSCIKYSYYDDGSSYCSQYRTFNVKCEARTYSVSTKVKLIKVSNASTLFTNTYSASKKLSKCVDHNKVLPSKIDQNTRLADEIARQLIIDIAPSYIYFSVVLMDSPDIDYTAIEEGYLKTALALIKNKRINKADTLLKKLSKSTKYQSYVAMYNYGVTLEARGDLKEALEFYKKAEDVSLMTEPQEEISQAIRRAEKNLFELNKAKSQI